MNLLNYKNAKFTKFTVTVQYLLIPPERDLIHTCKKIISQYIEILVYSFLMY